MDDYHVRYVNIYWCVWRFYLWRCKSRHPSLITLSIYVWSEAVARIYLGSIISGKVPRETTKKKYIWLTTSVKKQKIDIYECCHILHLYHNIPYTDSSIIIHWCRQICNLPWHIFYNYIVKLLRETSTNWFKTGRIYTSPVPEGLIGY